MTEAFLVVTAFGCDDHETIAVFTDKEAAFAACRKLCPEEWPSDDGETNTVSVFQKREKRANGDDGSIEVRLAVLRCPMNPTDLVLAETT